MGATKKPATTAPKNTGKLISSKKEVKEDTSSGMPSWFSLAAWPLRIYFLASCLDSAYQIRMFAIREYGRVIHEFDPWFNYRATEYLAEHGSEKFFKWYDYMSWYPLGRPVGTTIYPGMQYTSVWIWKSLDGLMSLNDVCCFVPVWFGVVATAILGMLTWEVTGSSNAAVAASTVMAIIPAHLMRSIGGGYDNESIAVTAMCASFYFWVRALRNDNSWWIGAVAGLAYVYMVATWGGYIFVLNMIGIHAGLLVLLGRFSSKLHRAYSLWYIIGTFGAMQVPVVGWTPLKSLEQLAPFGLFVLMQLLEYVEIQRKKLDLDERQVRDLRIKVLAGAFGVAVAIAAMLYPTGYFGPLSSRIRGLFVKHTRTGNPLVDSVAEHQPGSSKAYWQYLHLCMYAAPCGFALLCAKRNDQKYFLLAYAATAYYFANRMVRLVIIAGPVTSALTGVFLAYCLEFTGSAIWRHMGWVKADAGLPWVWASEQGEEKEQKGKNEKMPFFDDWSYPEFVSWWDSCYKTRAGIGLFLLVIVLPLCAIDFSQVSHRMAVGMSNPQIMYKAYHWLRDQTPQDARVMAWWDYGYQITGIANRTSIADGNTWNHEHIATLGRMLTSPVKDAHRAIRHLADYVLVWAGGQGDDMAKSPHLARIANSVFDGHCSGDPTCQLFGFNQDMSPTPMMAESLLYQMVQHGLRPGVSVDDSRFKLVFNSKYGKVRIFKVLSVSKESKAWVADPANRVCDAPGSWYCTGQYPPAFQSFIEKRRNFAQLEDFNAGDADTKKRSEKYQKEYMTRMDGVGGHRRL